MRIVNENKILKRYFVSILGIVCRTKVVNTNIQPVSLPVLSKYVQFSARD